MPANYQKIYRKLLPTNRRLLVNKFVAKSSSALKGKTLVVGAGMIDYSVIFTRSEVVINSDIEKYGDHISLILDAHNLKLDDNCVDNVVALEVLEHLATPKNAINEIYRVLKPGGTIMLSIPFLFRVHGDPSDYQRYTLFGLERLLENFHNVEIFEMGGRISVISDLITTGAKCLIPLRMFNHAISYFDKKGSKDSTTGYFVIAKKP